MAAKFSYSLSNRSLWLDFKYKWITNFEIQASMRFLNRIYIIEICFEPGIDFFLNFKIDSKKFIILNKIGGSFKHLIQ